MPFLVKNIVGNVSLKRLKHTQFQPGRRPASIRSRIRTICTRKRLHCHRRPAPIGPAAQLMFTRQGERGKSEVGRTRAHYREPRVSLSKVGIRFRWFSTTWRSHRNRVSLRVTVFAKLCIRATKIPINTGRSDTRCTPKKWQQYLACNLTRVRRL